MADSLQPSKILTENFLLLKLKKFLIVFALLSTNSSAEPIYSSFDSQFAQGLDHYKNFQFNKSMAIFNKLFVKYPECYRCVYYKGKSLGHLASKANWVKAPKLAVAALDSFKKAYLLNQTDQEVNRDLAKYYMEAPKILGGNIQKAKELKLKNKELKETVQGK